MENKLYGKGLIFYCLKENYEEISESIKKIYPLAKLEIIDKPITLPKLNEKEKKMLQLENCDLN